MTKHITIELTESQDAYLQAEAERLNVPVEQLVRWLVERKVEESARFIAAVEQGLAEADRGEFVSDEDFADRMAKLRADLLARQSGS